MRASGVAKSWKLYSSVYTLPTTFILSYPLAPSPPHPFSSLSIKRERKKINKVLTNHNSPGRRSRTRLRNENKVPNRRYNRFLPLNSPNNSRTQNSALGRRESQSLDAVLDYPCSSESRGMWHVISFSPAFFEIDIRFIPFRVFVCVCVFMCVYLRQHLSKDEESNHSYLKDPLIKQKGS